MDNKKGTGHPPATGTTHQTSHGVIVSQNLGDAKHKSNLIAQLALNGFECRECIEGGFFVSRWNLTKFCPAIGDLEAFVREVAK